MGGKDLVLGRGLIISDGIVEEDEAEDSDLVGETTSAGTLADDAVEGFISCVGEGLRLIEMD